MAIWIRRSRRFFPLVGRVRTDDPVFGTWPTDPQADDGIQHGGAREGGVAQALLVTDGGQPFEGPHTRRLAKGLGAIWVHLSGCLEVTMIDVAAVGLFACKGLALPAPPLI